MARVELKETSVHITLKLADEVLALHGSFEIPYTHIDEASSEAPDSAAGFFKGVKIGTNIPGVKTAGTFITASGTMFYDYTTGDRCLTLRLNHEHYREVVVEVDGDQDPSSLARSINARLPGR